MEVAFCYDDKLIVILPCLDRTENESQDRATLRVEGLS